MQNNSLYKPERRPIGILNEGKINEILALLKKLSVIAEVAIKFI